MKIGLTRRRLTTVMAASCLVSPVLGQTKPGSVLFAEDPRLSRPVTVSRARIYLGELLDQVSSDSGVPLTVDESKGEVGGIQLAVYLRERPVREVMKAIQELFTSRFDQWEWQSASRQAAGYVLRHQCSPLAASGNARQELMRTWAADLVSIHEIALLPDEQRAVRARSRPDLFPRGFPTGAAGIYDLLARLKRSDIDAVLRGAVVPIDTDQSSPRAAESLKFGQSNESQNTGLRVRPGFYMEWSEIGLGPLLLLRNRSGVATNAVGSRVWDDTWLKSQVPGWQVASDPVPQRFFQQKVARDPAAGAPLAAAALPAWLKQIAEKQPLNLLVDLVRPRPRETIGAAWLGRTPEQTLLALVVGAALNEKQSGEIHLLRDRSAVIHPRSHLVAWKEIKALRKAADRNDGYLDFPQLLQLAGLTNEQLAGLAEEFPDAHAAIQEWRPIFAFYNHLIPVWQAQVRSPNGIRFADTGLLARAALLEGPDPRRLRGLDLIDREPAQVRVFIGLETMPPRMGRDRKPVEREGRELIWEVRVPGGSTHRRGYRLAPRRPLQPDEPVPGSREATSGG